MAIQRKRPASVAAVIALVMACPLIASGPATAAKITKADVVSSTLVSSSIQIPFAAYGGGYISCLAHQRALTGGAYWNATGQGPQPGIADQGYLANSTVTDNDKGWYADGFHRSDAGALSFTQNFRCLPKDRLEQGKLSQKTVSASDFRKADALARCPSGTRVYTGGSYFHKQGEPPSPTVTGGSRTSASFPTKQGKGWYASGTGSVAEKDRLTVLAWCLPKDRLGPVQVFDTTQTLGDSQDGGGYIGCPGGTAALTGGAYWRRPGKDVQHSIGAGILSGSSFSSDVLSWYVAGQSAGDSHKLTTVVRCIGG
jgi:hypothetical protein